MRQPLLLVAVALTCGFTCVAQTKDSNVQSPKSVATPNNSDSATGKTARELEAARVLKERRASAQSLLINLAADARSFNNAVTRARTLARVASALWPADRERARAIFFQAWDAAEVAGKELIERSKTESYEQKSGPRVPYTTGPDVSQEVLRLASRRDIALGEELLLKMKERIRRENENGTISRTRTPLGEFDPMVFQRLQAARQLLDIGEIERALQFADPALGAVSQYTVDFLSSVREKNAVAADDRYAAMLLNATANPAADANTVSVLSSYLFTPHSYLGFDPGGTSTRSFPGNRTPPEVAGLRLAFFRAAAAILTRPLAPPGEEQNTSGHDGHYLVIKRLMPLFEQYAPPQITASLKAQLESLSALVTKTTRDRDDDDWVKSGIRPDNMEENWEKSLRDQLDHAKTSAERDKIFLQLASLYASKVDLHARDFVDEVADPETRRDARVYIDIRLARNAVAKKDTDLMMELIRSGELDHVYKSWLFAQAAKLSVKSDSEKAGSLADSAIAEARRISPSDAEAPQAFVGAANVMFLINRSAVWETVDEAIKKANSAENFTGEDAELVYYLFTKGGPSFGSSERVPDFDLEGIFTKLAEYDYDKTVQLARGLNRDAPRAIATIAIARFVLEDRRK